MRSSRSAGGSTRDRVRQRLAERLPAGRPARRPGRELAVIQDEQGYLAEAVIGADGVDPPRRAQLRDPPGRRGARRPPARPSSSSSASVLGADVERETHIAAGDRCCTYRIGERPDQTCGLGLFALHDDARGPAPGRGGGTSETFGTNEAASEVAAACSWSSTRQDPEATQRAPSRRGCRS